MRLGLLFHRFTPDGAALASAARHAEAAGIDTIWVMDHVRQVPWQGPASDPALEAYTTLGFLAGVTGRVRLGALVSGVALRDPAMLVKQATTLDVLCGGRSVFGIGAGWFEDEVLALGRPMPPLAKRFALLEDTIRLARATWAGQSGPFRGAALDLPDTLPAPPPARPGGPPILVGGAGERKTLRLVARHADLCNLSFAHLDMAGVRDRIATLHRHCEAEGRDPAAIAITTTRGFGSPTPADADGLMAFLGELAAMGVDQHVFTLDDPADPAAWATIREHVIPRLPA